MLLIIGFITVTAVVTGFRLRRGMPSANLGWMSAQWLAEYRASHAS